MSHEEIALICEMLESGISFVVMGWVLTTLFKKP